MRDYYTVSSFDASCVGMYMCTPTIVVLAEVGRYPLRMSAAAAAIIMYWNQLVRMDAGRLVDVHDGLYQNM